MYDIVASAYTEMQYIGWLMLKTVGRMMHGVPSH